MNHSILCAAFILTVAVILHSSGAQEACRSENCLSPEKCESFARSLKCPNKADTCCSLVRQEYRKLCYHSGGECVKAKCPKRLIQEKALDCNQDEVCCILVV